MGLSSRSTCSEIYSAADRATRAAALGRGVNKEAEIRAAVGALSNPRRRLQQRLFWFYGATSLEHPSAPATSLDPAEAAHDVALRNVAMADFDDTATMVASLRQWHAFVAERRYWELLADLEREGGFEPAAVGSEIASLEADAVSFAAEPFIRAAKDACSRVDFPALQRFMGALQELKDTGPWAAESRRSLLAPISGRLQDACETLKKHYSSKVVRQNDFAECNKLVCAGALEYYRNFIEPVWKTIAGTLSQEDSELSLARGQTADCLCTIARDQTWAGEFRCAGDLAVEAMTLAAGTIVEERLRLNLGSLLDSAKGRYVDQLTSVLKSFDAAFADRLVSKDKAACTEAIAFYRDSVEPVLDRLMGAFSAQLEDGGVWRGRAGEYLCSIATAFSWIEDFVRAEELVYEALVVAQGTEATARIQEGLAQLQMRADLQRKRRADKPISDSARELVHHHCRAITLTLGRRIIPRRRYGLQNQLECNRELAFFRAQVQPSLRLVTDLSVPGEGDLIQLRQEVALCLACIAGNYIWADDVVLAEHLMQEALQLAGGAQAAEAIQERLRGIRRASCQARLDFGSFQEKPASRKRRWWLLGIGSSLVAVVAVAMEMNTPVKPITVHVPNRQTGTHAGGPPNTIDPPPPLAAAAETNLRLNTIDAEIKAENRQAEDLARKIKPLLDNIDLFHKEELFGQRVDPSDLEATLNNYNQLHRQWRNLILQRNAKVQQRDLLAAKPAHQVEDTP